MSEPELLKWAAITAAVLSASVAVFLLAGLPGVLVAAALFDAVLRRIEDARAYRHAKALLPAEKNRRPPK